MKFDVEITFLDLEKDKYSGTMYVEILQSVESETITIFVLVTKSPRWISLMTN